MDEGGGPNKYFPYELLAPELGPKRLSFCPKILPITVLLFGPPENGLGF